MNMIDLCADIAWMFYKHARDTSDTPDTLIYQSRLEQSRIIVDKEINSLTEFLRDLKHDKAFITEQLNRLYTKYLHDVKQRKESLVNLLEILLGNTETHEEPQPTPTVQEEVEPAQKPQRKSRAKKLKQESQA